MILDGFCPNLSDLVAANWEQILESCSEKEVYHFAAAFRRKAFEFANAGDTANASLFGFLTEIASFVWKATAHNPFEPDVIGADVIKVSTPADLSDAQLAILSDLVPSIIDPEMKARVADVVWARRRDRVTAGLAELGVEAYLASATRLEHPEKWSPPAFRIQRALNLAKMLKKEHIVRRVISHIEGILARYQGDDPLYLSAHMMDLLLQIGEGDASNYTSLAERAARNAQAAGDFDRARRYLELKVKWLHRVENSGAADATKIEIAESYVKEADRDELAAPPNYMRAEHYLERAIQAYRLIGHQDSRIEELHKRLLNDQKLGIKQLKGVRVGTMDLTKMTEETVSLLSGKTFQEMLFWLAIRLRPPSVERIRKEVEARGPGIADTVHHQILDSSGKVVAQAPRRDRDDPEQLERVTQFEMRNHAKLYRLITAYGVIEVARREILLEHAVTTADWIPLLVHSPFVPVGREEIFARGLQAGLIGDFLVAGHLLIPQIENSLRNFLDSNGIVASNLDQRGIQEDLTIDALFSRERVKEIFPADLEFDLTGLLVRKAGPNLRNRLAHGLISQEEFLSYDLLYLWGLVIHLCLLPLALHQLSSEEPSKSG
jgi:hypothetical protein